MLTYLNVLLIMFIGAGILALAAVILTTIFLAADLFFYTRKQVRADKRIAVEQAKEDIRTEKEKEAAATSFFFNDSYLPPFAKGFHDTGELKIYRGRHTRGTVAEKKAIDFVADGEVLENTKEL